MAKDNKVVSVDAAIDAVKKLKNCQSEVQAISDTIKKVSQSYEQMPNIGVLASVVCPTLNKMDELLPDLEQSLSALAGIIQQALESMEEQQRLGKQLMNG